MNKYIYKIRNKIVSGDEENPVITYEDIEPKLLACVPVVIPKPYKVINEDGTEEVITPQLEIHKFYPLWEDDTMVYYDKDIYKKEKPVPTPDPPHVPTPEEEKEALLNQYKNRIIEISREICIGKELEYSGWIDVYKLIDERDELIQKHKAIAEEVAKDV